MSVVLVAEDLCNICPTCRLVTHQCMLCWMVAPRVHTLVASCTSGAYVQTGYTLDACNVGRLHFSYMYVVKNEIVHTMLACPFP